MLKYRSKTIVLISIVLIVIISGGVIGNAGVSPAESSITTQSEVTVSVNISSQNNAEIIPNASISDKVMDKENDTFVSGNEILSEKVAEEIFPDAVPDDVTKDRPINPEIKEPAEEKPTEEPAEDNFLTKAETNENQFPIINAGVFEGADTATKKAFIQSVAQDAAARLQVPCQVVYYQSTGTDFAYTDQTEPGVVHINELMLLSDEAVRVEARGMTVDEYVKCAVAHEVRHLYQYVHANDLTAYGEQVRQGIMTRTSPDIDVIGYALNFLEKDARQFGWEYAGI